MAEHDEPLDEDEDEVDDEDQPGCPICGDDPYEGGFCPHMVLSRPFDPEVSTWMRSTEGEDQGQPPTKAGPDEFGDVVKEFVNAWLLVEEGLPENFLETLVPRHLVKIVKDLIDQDELSRFEFDEYLSELVVTAPTYAGSVWCESDSLAGSAWRNYYARDAAACALAVEERLAQDVLALRTAIDKLAAEGGASGSGEGS
jgi:hypothetical protein